jgi:hypothetical protein
MKILTAGLITLIFSGMAWAVTTLDAVSQVTAIMEAQNKLLENFSADVRQITTEESGGQIKTTEYNLLFYKARDEKAKTYINRAVRLGQDVTQEERNKEKRDRQQEFYSPFDKRYQPDYEYELIESGPEGYAIRVSPKKDTSRHIKGRYWTDSEFYLVKSQEHPAKNPQFINDLKIEKEYTRFKGRYLLPRQARNFIDISALFFYQGKISTMQFFDNYQVNVKPAPEWLKE